MQRRLFFFFNLLPLVHIVALVAVYTHFPAERRRGLEENELWGSAEHPALVSSGRKAWHSRQRGAKAEDPHESPASWGASRSTSTLQTPRTAGNTVDIFRTCSVRWDRIKQNLQCSASSAVIDSTYAVYGKRFGKVWVLHRSAIWKLKVPLFKCPVCLHPVVGTYLWCHKVSHYTLKSDIQFEPLMFYCGRLDFVWGGNCIFFLMLHCKLRAKKNCTKFSLEDCLAKCAVCRMIWWSAVSTDQPLARQPKKKLNVCDPFCWRNLCFIIYIFICAHTAEEAT